MLSIPCALFSLSHTTCEVSSIIHSHFVGGGGAENKALRQEVTYQGHRASRWPRCDWRLGLAIWTLLPALEE